MIRLSPFRRLALLLMLALFALPLSARDLYVAEVPLEQGASVAGSDLLRALDQVLVRLTGQVEQSPVALLGLGSGEVSQMLVSQQRFQQSRSDASGRTVESLWLRAEFYPQAVDRLLEREQWPRLGRERPSILLWATLDDYDSGARFLSDALVEQALDAQARRLGLDLFRPLGDALDMAEVQLADVRGGFLDAAEPAADRYGAGMTAMLDLREEDDHWAARWSWRLDGRDAGLSLSADRPEDLIAPGLEAILSALAARYGVRRGGEDTGIRRVLVDGVVDEIQYAEVLRDLGGLSVVDQLRVVAARGRQVEFELVLGGSGLEDQIALSRVLVVDRQLPDGRLLLRLAR
jgi:uncharacterized protein